MSFPCRSSDPCGFPSSSSDPVTSRMSSTIWNRTPSSSAKRRYGIVAASGVPREDQRHADAGADQPSRLERVQLAQAGRRRAPRPPSRRRTGRRPCPRPRSPPVSSPSAASTRSGSPSWRSQNSRIASAKRPSPARIATSSPYFTCEVGPPAAQLVVVHRRQVVVDQRVGVDQLDRGRGGQHRLGLGAGRARGGQREHRADPLAPGEQRVAHRLVEPGGRGTRRRSRARPGSPRPARAGRRGSQLTPVVGSATARSSSLPGLGHQVGGLAGQRLGLLLGGGLVVAGGRRSRAGGRRSRRSRRRRSCRLVRFPARRPPRRGCR